MAQTLPPIALALRAARKHAGLSQYELARQSGVARITIANIEGGKHPTIRTGTAEKLAAAMGLTVGELIAAQPVPNEALGKATPEQLLENYQDLKRGTVMAATPQETGWLLHMLTAWRGGTQPSPTSVLFLLLSLRHGVEATPAQ